MLLSLLLTLAVAENAWTLSSMWINIDKDSTVLLQVVDGFVTEWLDIWGNYRNKNTFFSCIINGKVKRSFDNHSIVFVLSYFNVNVSTSWNGYMDLNISNNIITIQSITSNSSFIKYDKYVRLTGP